jgi:hypothetical protein
LHTKQSFDIQTGRRIFTVAWCLAHTGLSLLLYHFAYAALRSSRSLLEAIIILAAGLLTFTGVDACLLRGRSYRHSLHRAQRLLMHPGALMGICTAILLSRWALLSPDAHHAILSDLQAVALRVATLSRPEWPVSTDPLDWVALALVVLLTVLICGYGEYWLKQERPWPNVSPRMQQGTSLCGTILVIGLLPIMNGTSVLLLGLICLLPLACVDALPWWRAPIPERIFPTAAIYQDAGPALLQAGRMVEDEDLDLHHLGGGWPWIYLGLRRKRWLASLTVGKTVVQGVIIGAIFLPMAVEHSSALFFKSFCLLGILLGCLWLWLQRRGGRPIRLGQPGSWTGYLRSHLAVSGALLLGGITTLALGLGHTPSLLLETLIAVFALSLLLWDALAPTLWGQPFREISSLAQEAHLGTIAEARLWQCLDDRCSSLLDLLARAASGALLPLVGLAGERFGEEIILNALGIALVVLASISLLLWVRLQGRRKANLSQRQKPGVQQVRAQTTFNAGSQAPSVTRHTLTPLAQSSRNTRRLKQANGHIRLSQIVEVASSKKSGGKPETGLLSKHERRQAALQRHRKTVVLDTTVQIRRMKEGW